MCVISCQGLAGCVCGCRWRLWGCLGEVWWVPVGEAGLGGVRTSPPGPSATSARAMTARRREGKVSAWRKKIGLFQSIAKNDIFGPSWTLCIINIKSFILSLCIFFPLEVCHSFDEMRQMWSGTKWGTQQMLFFWAFAIMKCFFGCSGSSLPTQLVNIYIFRQLSNSRHQGLYPWMEDAKKKLKRYSKKFSLHRIRGKRWRRWTKAWLILLQLNLPRLGLWPGEAIGHLGPGHADGYGHGYDNHDMVMGMLIMCWWWQQWWWYYLDDEMMMVTMVITMSWQGWRRSSNRSPPSATSTTQPNHHGE